MILSPSNLGIRDPGAIDNCEDHFRDSKSLTIVDSWVYERKQPILNGRRWCGCHNGQATKVSRWILEDALACSQIPYR